MTDPTSPNKTQQEITANADAKAAKGLHPDPEGNPFLPNGGLHPGDDTGPILRDVPLAARMLPPEEQARPGKGRPAVPVTDEQLARSAEMQQAETNGANDAMANRKDFVAVETIPVEDRLVDKGDAPKPAKKAA